MKLLSLSTLSACMLLMTNTYAADITTPAANIPAAKTTKDESNYKGAQTPCPTPPKLNDGFYLGAQMGYDAWKVRINTGNNFNPAAGVSNPTLMAQGVVGGLFFCFGRSVSDNLYLGGEVFADLSSADVNYSVSSAIVPLTLNKKFTVSGSYGIAVLPGVKLNNEALLYARLGWTRANMKGVENATIAGTSYATTSTNWQNGFTYGAGIEARVYENWSIRGDYNYTAYTAFRDSFGSKFTPSNGQIVVGLIYHFI